MRKNNSAFWLFTLILLLPLQASADTISTNTVKFSQGSSINALAGSTFTIDLIGTNFLVGPDGASFGLSWNPQILSYVDISIANPPWDTAYVSDSNAPNGIIDYIFLSSTTGTTLTDFALASFTFNVVATQEQLATISLNLDPFNVGFVSPDAEPINVNFYSTQVNITTATTIPVPATAWLLGTGLFAISAVTRRIRSSAKQANS